MALVPCARSAVPEEAISAGLAGVYQRRAQQCRDVAERTPEGRQRRDWLHMAERWEKLISELEASPCS
jgi:hypothetical protein